ncbi:MAG TPA: Flp pilus assembly protein CpaB [Caulobacteraceae bacterium]|nr:Flp pilus assembly protein CpaB [Caulobacteraceae bacterium]
MKPVRIVILGVAAVSAIGLAVVVRSAMGGSPTSQANAAALASVPVKPMAKVLVAKRDLKVGERLTAADMEWQPWPVDSVNAAFVTDGSVEIANPLTSPEEEEAEGDDKDKSKKDAKDEKSDAKKDKKSKADKQAGKKDDKGAAQAVVQKVAMLGDGGPKAQFVGAVVREPFLAGEPIVDRKVVRAGESGYLAVVLAPGMRAMAVPVTVETAAGGFILPADRVDVLLSREVQSGTDGGKTSFVSETVLRNVKVLAIDQVTQPDKNATTVVGATATLELGPLDAEALALAMAQGELSLTLRSYADAGGPSGRTPRAAAQAQGANLAPTGPNPPAARTVRIFRNGEASDVTVM